MPIPDGMRLTKAGLILLAKAMTGKELKFTKGYTGDGILPDGMDILEMTDLISPKRELPILSMEITPKAGTALLVFEMTNAALEQGFFLREYGIFAADPDTEEEILYAYRNVGDNASYLPGAQGPDIVSYTLSISVVIDQAENVIAQIIPSDNYVTHTYLDTKINSLFGPSDAINYFWTHKTGDYQKLRPASLQKVKEALLGKYDPDNLSSRMEIVENAIMQMLLTMEGINLYPDYMNFILEDFNDTSQLDMSHVKVTSIVTADDSIDVNDVMGLLPYSCYTLSDGLTSEQVQIKSTARESGINRVIFTEPVKGSYIVDNTELYRTSAIIANGQAGLGSGSDGSASVKGTVWTANITWRGYSDAQVVELDLSPKISETSNYEMSSGISITSDGFFQLG